MIVIINTKLSPIMVQDLVTECALSDEQAMSVSLDTALRMTPKGITKVMVSNSLPTVTTDYLREIFGDIIEPI